MRYVLIKNIGIWRKWRKEFSFLYIVLLSKVSLSKEKSLRTPIEFCTSDLSKKLKTYLVTHYVTF